MPAYRFHVSGQAVVTLAGKDLYLGPHHTPESRARYFELVLEYNANGKQASDAPTHQIEQAITVRTVTGECREHIKTPMESPMSKTTSPAGTPRILTETVISVRKGPSHLASR